MHFVSGLAIVLDPTLSKVPVYPNDIFFHIKSYTKLLRLSDHQIVTRKNNNNHHNHNHNHNRNHNHNHNHNNDHNNEKNRVIWGSPEDLDRCLCSKAGIFLKIS